MDETWGLIICCLGSAAFYLLSQSSDEDAEALKSVKRVGQFKELAKLLDIKSKVSPLVVAISGRIGSETPISCKYSGLRGVIVEERAEQHFLKQNDTGKWMKDSALMSKTSKEVPWYLDDGTGRVFVRGAQAASGFSLTVCSKTFEEFRGKLDHPRGFKMLGVKHIERVLPTGNSLTIVGEAVKDSTGTLRIQRPYDGPFYVSCKTIDELIENLGNWGRCYKYVSIGFAAFGVILIAIHAVQVSKQIIMQIRHRWEMRRALSAAAKRSSQKIDNKRERPIPDLCVVCLEQEYNAAFLPCGHLCCCVICSSRLNNCPLCRRWIEQVVKTFCH